MRTERSETMINMNRKFTDEEKKAIADLELSLTDPDRREYYSNWFAKDLDLILNILKEIKEVE